MDNIELVYEEMIRLEKQMISLAEKIYSGVSHGVCPRKEDVFRAFQFFPAEETRVVILGQDPYHTLGKASGLAFGYHNDYIGPLDSSLQNIVAELQSSGYSVPEVKQGSERKDWYTLEHWARQGILLLNTRLTVELGKPMSHAGLGWEELIQGMIKCIHSIRGPKVAWMLWGNEAQQMFDEVGLDLDTAHTVRTSHPCNYSHTRGRRPFTGSNCFTEVNEYLESMSVEAIQW